MHRSHTLALVTYITRDNYFKCHHTLVLTNYNIRDSLIVLVCRVIISRVVLTGCFMGIWRAADFTYLLAFLNQPRAGCRPVCTWFLKVYPVRIVGMRACMCVHT